MRYDINPLRSAEHIASKIYRTHKRISQIPEGIYIAASHYWLAKLEFITTISAYKKPVWKIHTGFIIGNYAQPRVLTALTTRLMAMTYAASRMYRFFSSASS